MQKVLILIVFMACASDPVNRVAKGPTLNTPKISDSGPAKPSFSMLPKQVVVRPGKVRFLNFKTNLDNGSYEFDCTDKKVLFTVSSGHAQAYLAESYFSNLKTEQCQFKDQSLFSIVKKVFPYKSEKLNVDRKRVFLNAKDLKRVIKEKKIKDAIYTDSAKKFLFNEPFRVPLNSFVTSHYGNKRLFNNKKATQHLGNDLRASVGVKIPAANSGKVVYTGNLFYSGNIVVVDHGLEIFSIYGHLSKILVRPGQTIGKGEIVGLAGATGRVSGPHLHWGIKIQGSWIDGFSLVEASSKQFQ